MLHCCKNTCAVSVLYSVLNNNPPSKSDNTTTLLECVLARQIQITPCTYFVYEVVVLVLTKGKLCHGEKKRLFAEVHAPLWDIKSILSKMLCHTRSTHTLATCGDSNVLHAFSAKPFNHNYYLQSLNQN